MGYFTPKIWWLPLRGALVCYSEVCAIMVRKTGKPKLKEDEYRGLQDADYVTSRPYMLSSMLL